MTAKVQTSKRVIGMDKLKFLNTQTWQCQSIKSNLWSSRQRPNMKSESITYTHMNVHLCALVALLRCHFVFIPFTGEFVSRHPPKSLAEVAALINRCPALANEASAANVNSPKIYTKPHSETTVSSQIKSRRCTFSKSFECASTRVAKKHTTSQQLLLRHHSFRTLHSHKLDRWQAVPAVPGIGERLNCCW